MKILLCNEAHIGDLILSTSLLPALKKAIPDCKIGFLAGSWAKEVVEDHVFVDWVHFYDQASINRSNISKREKKQREALTKKAALKNVEEVGYDIALDLHSYYTENSASFLFHSRIPERVAYWHCNKPFFYNRILFWECRHFHMLENHRVMLKEWGVDEEHLENFQPCLQYSKEIKSSHYKDLPDKYFVVHVGTGAEAREWETTSWRVLALKLDALGYPLVFIGKGQRERGKIELAIKGLNNALNFCDKFSWKELIPVIKNAKFLIGLESMAGHMAAAYSIPALLIYAGESFVNWRPYHPYCQTIKPPEKYWFELEKIHPKMPIHMISPEEVFEKAQKILKAHRLL